MSGKKFDSGLDKLSWDLMPFDAVEGLIRILDYGRRKYTTCNNCQGRVYPNPRLDNGDPPRSDCPHCGSTDLSAGEHNWRKGFAWSRLIAATFRHLVAILKGEDRDPESGELHAFHLMACVSFLAEHQTRKLGVDDRFKYSVEEETKGER